MDARVPEASVDICRLAQNSRSVTHHAQTMTCTGETLDARPVREQSGGEQWACQVAGHAGDLQPSIGRGRLRRREEARRRFDCVRERVKRPPFFHRIFFFFFICIGPQARKRSIDEILRSDLHYTQPCTQSL